MVYDQEIEVVLEALQEFYYTCIEKAAYNFRRGNMELYTLWTDKSQQAYRLRNELKEKVHG